MNPLEKIQEILEVSQDPQNPTAQTVMDTLESVKRIAVVGISRNPEKAARRVPSYLATQGYEIIPVNPFVDRILGKEALDSLDQIQDPVDMVLVFRPSQEAAAIVSEAMGRKEKPAIWLQEGIRADEAVSRAREEGVRVIQDLCAYKIHRAMKEV
jgi:predicted CoA-binding protein